MIILTRKAREECCGKYVIMGKIALKSNKGELIYNEIFLPDNDYKIRTGKCGKCGKIFLRSTD